MPAYSSHFTMAASRQGGDLDTIRFLIDQGADVRDRTKSGYTALNGAASWPGNGAAIHLLLEVGWQMGTSCDGRKGHSYESVHAAYAIVC